MSRVEWRKSSPSTNSELRELVRDSAGLIPHGTVLVTADQTAGRGRLGRDWVTPPNTALAISVLIRNFGEQGLGASWLPLIAGSAVAETLQTFFDPANADQSDTVSGLRVGVKWPNDVHVRDEFDAEAGRPGLKLCGILCEVVSPDAIIVGMGVNLLIPEWELPTERAGSVLAAGGDVGGVEDLSSTAGMQLADRVLAGIGAGLLRLSALAAVEPDRVRSRILRHSLTLGSEVRVHLPGGELVDGRAVGLDEDGALIVDLPTGGQLTVSAADIEHLR